MSASLQVYIYRPNQSSSVYIDLVSLQDYYLYPPWCQPVFKCIYRLSQSSRLLISAVMSGTAGTAGTAKNKLFIFTIYFFKFFSYILNYFYSAVPAVPAVPPYHSLITLFSRPLLKR